MKYGCIGEKLGHSFSKEIHNLLADYPYELKEIPKGKLDAFMTEKDFSAINVTIPYKQDVIPHLSHLSDTARMIGAVNTIVNENGSLFGYNTDFGGMTKLFKSAGISPKDKKVLILGTGGTSKTALAAAKYLGAKEVYKVSRTGKEGSLTYEQAYHFHHDAHILINTTPCGMFPNAGESAVEIRDFPLLEGVADAVYNPLRSKLVQDGEKRKIPSAGGLYMLVMQAVLACEIFTGKKIPEEKQEKVYHDILKEKQNIVLIGMPGSGKSSVGKHLAEHLHKELVDTDQMIVDREGTSIREIFETKGEGYFRQLEKETVAEVSQKNGLIISTGGGAVLRDDNVMNLRSNGQVFFLDRDLKNIHPTQSRPLSSNQEDLEKRYHERYPIYCQAADVHIITSPTQDETARRIEGIFLQ